MKTPCIKKGIKQSVVLFGTILALVSCGEVYDLNGYDWEPNTPASDSAFNREIQVLNLGDNMPVGHKPVDSQDPIFFSLEKFSSVATAYRSTERWDITFSGTARSAIIANNGSQSGFGYGSSGIGGIVVLDGYYDDITEVPEDHLFKRPGYAGLDDQGHFGEPMGHVVYTFFGNFIRESLGPNQQEPPIGSYWHMVYGLNKELIKAFPNAKGLDGKPLQPRTIIVKTAAGNYAKIETQSFYKDTMDPLKMMRHPDITSAISFRYIVIKAEEKRFGFVERKKKLTVNMSTRRTTVSP